MKQPIECVIADYLAAYPDLKAIHNGQSQQGLAEENWKPPYQNLFVISDPPDMKRLGIPTPRLQINNVSSVYTQSKRMAELTYDALDGFYGELEGITIEHGSYLDLIPIFERETKLWITQIDIMVVYHKT